VPDLTLEQELERVILGSDYRIAVREYSGALVVEVIYVPAFQAVDMGGRLPLVTNTGVVAYRRIGGWRKWRRARRFVERTIAGHREVLAAGVVQVR
jgi:hypothetical protein